MSSDDDADETTAVEGEAEGVTQSDGTERAQMTKKMVRLALASEYARQPIRRVDIAAKGRPTYGGHVRPRRLTQRPVLGQNSRQFKRVFGDAQKELQTVFGMEMVELPVREKVTISQRRGIHLLRPTQCHD